MELKMIQGSATYESKETTERGFDLAAPAQINTNHELSSINGGSVRKEQKSMATFSLYDKGGLSVSWSNGVTADEQIAILLDINEFIESIENAVKEVTL